MSCLAGLFPLVDDLLVRIRKAISAGKRCGRISARKKGYTSERVRWGNHAW